jgi:predicted  nucleic acid-binding Zn-ribbon protein
MQGLGGVPGLPFVGLANVEEDGALVDAADRLLGGDGRGAGLALHTTMLRDSSPFGKSAPRKGRGGYRFDVVTVLENLLVVQEHDSAVDRLRHRRETLPEQARLLEVEKGVAETEAALAELGQQRDEVVRRQQRHEDELTSLESKIAEVDRKLYSGSVSAPRELQALQADVASLKRHRSDIEDQVLLAMQDREPLDVEVGRLEAQWEGLEGELEALGKAIGELTGAIDAELTTELDARTAAAASVPDELLSQYERLRTRLDGVGAARLVNGRCSGCHLTLPATELDRIRHEGPDTVVLCDQCGRILVR